MPVYQHLQQVKRAQPLPMAQQVSTCITCSYWNVETPRPESEAQMVGTCIQPELRGFALIVSGASGCNHWHEQPDAGAAAKAYADQGVAHA